MGENALLCNVLRAKYSRRSLERNDLVVKVSDSYTWKSLAKIWPSLSSFETWAVGGRSKINIWADKWIGPSIRLDDLGIVVPAHMREWKVCAGA